MQVRNKIIHNGMSLSEAGLQAYNDIMSRHGAKLQIFSRVRPHRDLPSRLYFTMARLITTAFFKHLGIGQDLSILPGMKAY